jgi:hypothetical protein
MSDILGSPEISTAIKHEKNDVTVSFMMALQTLPEVIPEPEALLKHGKIE